MSDNQQSSAGGPQGPPGLAAVFPGEAVEVRSLGRTVIVAEWPAKALAHEIPAKLEGLFTKAARAKADTVAGVLSAAMPEVVSIVLWTAGIPDAELDRMTAGEVMRLAAAAARQNKDFFAATADLLGQFGVRIGGEAGSGSPAA